MPLTDDELIDKVRAGNFQSFEELIDRYRNQVFNFVYRILGSRDEAEDILQDTFMKVYQHLPRYKKQSKFSSYLFTIAHNLSMNRVNYRKRSQMKLDTLAQSDDEKSITDRTPDSQMRENEIASVVHKAIEKLPPKYRAALVLSEFEGFSYKQIGDVLNCSVGTVKSRIFRARDLLRGHLKGYEEQGLQETLN
ncbi:MAG: sigma-70 family RNA polymerase sigma factor [Candidatus Coatesbacteria bacterium]|nr:sigma-70 family RNA polymerase sigma factor [Candidatus Coatesbacteria bacterium]